MTQVTSSWPRIMTIINALWTKQTQNPKKIILNFFALKLNQILKWATKNILAVNFTILKSNWRQREKLVAVVGILTI